VSDTMLLGVLRMPIDYVGGPLSPVAQLVSRARQAADRIESDAAKIDDLLAALKSARDELMGLPRSLGYEFTHLPSIEAAIAKAEGA